MTKVYTGVGLPAFYRHAHFIKLHPDSIYAGGVTPPAFTTLSIFHIARSFDNQEIQYMFYKGSDDILRPILKPKGVEREIGVYEARRDLWRVNRLIPPPTGSEMEKKWFAENRVTDEEELLRAQDHP